MDSAAQDIVDGNEFGRREAEQERAAFMAAMEKEPDSSHDDPREAGCVNPSLVDGEKAPESGPKPVAALPSIVGGVLKQKQRHGTLVLEGVCTHCAHCGQPLSDSESVERGIGPVCSKKGYFEEPKDADEMQALIDIAEYPELADFLAKNYKPQGIRGMVNGLVRVCSLNRKTEVHQACTDAIESLGYKMLASLLRESLCVVEVKDHEYGYRVWVKKSEWKPAWSWSLRQIPGAYLSRQEKGWIVQKEHKRQLWNLILKYYENYFIKTKDGAVRIRRQKKP